MLTPYAVYYYFHMLNNYSAIETHMYIGIDVKFKVEAVFFMVVCDLSFNKE